MLLVARCDKAREGMKMTLINLANVYNTNDDIICNVQTSSCTCYISRIQVFCMQRMIIKREYDITLHLSHPGRWPLKAPQVSVESA